MPDVVVVGGGVIGLASARALAQHGLSVTVVEAGGIGGQASGAAAGMLAPGAESHEPSPFLDLLVASHRRYPDLARALREETDRSIALVQSGVVRVASSPEMADTLRRRVGWLRRAGVNVEPCDARQLHQLVPGIGLDASGGLWLPDEGHVVSTRLVHALAAAAKHAGATIREGVRARRLVGSASRIRAVDTSNETISAGTVVLAAGTWTSELWPFASLPVRPIRGQILAVQAPLGATSHVVYGDDVYLVPKTDGSIVVGATEDDAGYVTHSTVAGMAHLLTKAPELMPALESARFNHAWAGLRPMTPDKLPIFGKVADNVVVATGHYRNGILLTPISGEIVAALVTGAEPPLDLTPYAPDRFAVG